MIKKYFKIWKRLAACAAGSYLSNRIDSGAYFLGKLVRFGFFLLLIFSIFNHTGSLAGYSKYEVILFFLTFNLLDVMSQAFFRGIYMFQNEVRSGNFDYILSKPVNALFFSLTRLSDILDAMFLVPIAGLTIYAIFKLPLSAGWENIFGYSFFIFNGIIIITAIHILTACVTIWSTENENSVWLYREAMTIGRVPPEVFPAAVQAFFTFAIPVAVIVAFPAKAMLGILNWRWMAFGFLYAISFFALSLMIWRASLKKYSSASS